MVSFTATEVNVNALLVPSNGYLLFTFGLMVGFLLAWDVKTSTCCQDAQYPEQQSTENREAGRWGHILKIGGE